MAGTRQAEPLTLEEAARTIEAARGYEGPLRRRTEGVTWMIWGLVAAGIQLSFEAAGDLLQGDWPIWLDPVILIGWPVLGVLMTYAVWRIAVLDRPGLRGYRWRSILGSLLWLPVVYVAMAAVYLLGVPWSGALIPLIGIGLTWLTLGLADAFKSTRWGRGTLVVVGGIILVTGLLVGISVDLTTSAGRDLSALLVILVAGGVPLLAGLLQTLRG